MTYFMANSSNPSFYPWFFCLCVWGVVCGFFVVVGYFELSTETSMSSVNKSSFVCYFPIYIPFLLFLFLPSCMSKDTERE